MPQQVAHGIANLQCIPLLAKDLVNTGNISSHGLDLFSLCLALILPRSQYVLEKDVLYL